MSIRAATATAACIVALAVSDLADQHADPGNRDQALQELRRMIAPSPDAKRDYAIALELWQRENGAGSTRAEPRSEAPHR